MKVQVVIFDGFDELDAIAPFEVLRTAAEMAAVDLQVEMVSLDGEAEIVAEIVAAHGLRVRPQGRLGVGAQPDLLIVPGGGWASRGEQGAWAEAQRGKLPQAIARLHGAGTVVASVCTGGMLVAAAGLVRGRPATTHHVAIEELRQAGAETPIARVVDDGDLLSSGGVTSGLDLALWVLEREFGPQVALKVELELEYERRGTVWRR